MAGVSDRLRGTVLVVEKSRATRDAYAGLLEDDGHRVIVTATCRDALAQSARHRVDIVLAELLHDGASGRDMVRRIRGEERPKPTGAIYVTACAVDEVLRDSLNSWECVLTKPVTFSRVEQLIQQFLHTRGFGADS